MWDAELPHMKPSLFLTELPNFFRNRKIIHDFISTTKHEIKVAEYPSPLLTPILTFLGVKFNPKKYPIKKNTTPT